MAVYDDWKYGRGPKKGKLKPVSARRGMRWRATYPEPNNKNGVGEKFFDIKTEAEAFDARKKSEKARGVAVDEKAGQQLIGTYVWTWLDSLRLKPRSRKTYEGIIRVHIVPFFGRMRVVGATRTDVNIWVKQKVEAKLAPATVCAIYDVLAGMFKSAVLDQIRGTTPCTKITNLPPRPKRSNKKPKWLPTPIQVAALVRACVPRFRLAILIAAGCGLRFAEVMGLTTDDVDLARGVVRVRRALSQDCDCGAKTCMDSTKSANSVRDVRMPPRVARAVTAHIAAGYTRTVTMVDHTADEPGERTLTLMFATVTGKPVTRSQWSGVWGAAITAAGKILAEAPRGHTGFTLHTLRHLYGSLLIAGGANVVEVQEAMGHASPTITLDVYSWPTGRETALALVDEMLGDDDPDLAA